MDLVERKTEVLRRHPWEQSRASALQRILSSPGPRVGSILDVGCGDAYTGRALLTALGADSLAGVDVHLSPEQCLAYSAGDARVSLHRELSELAARRFDLALLCDVIEHVEDDTALLRSVAAHVVPSGRLLVTVPAFQPLFAEQDRALKHFRRYSLGQLEQRLHQAGLVVLRSGYLFGSLLYVRAFEKLVELARGPRASSQGIGSWAGGELVTRALSLALGWDNALLVGLAKHGIKLPGLSCWALCEK